MPNVVNGSGGNVIPTQTIVKEPLTPSQTQVIEDEETLKQMVVDDDLMQVNGAYVLRTEEGEFFKEKTKEEEGNAGEYLSAAHVTNGIMARKNKNEQNKYPEGEKKHMIRIVVDAMGGDYAPHEPIVGAVDALKKNKDLTVVLVGDEEQIKAELSAFEYDKDRIEIVHTTEVITMEEEDVAKAVKRKKDASIVVSFRMLKEGKADALVSSGSTGGVLSAGVLVLGRLKGVSRPALCPRIPNHRRTGTVVCDCGANLECKPINLAHFAIMASAYSEAAFGIKNPRVGLLNNGTEDHKGLLLQRESHALLKTMDFLNYAGNIEGRDIMFSDVDVVVSDGFSGNIAVKSIEGCGKAIGSIMGQEFKRNWWCKLRAGGVVDIIKRIRGSVDYQKLGGAVFLGLTKPVVKGHGNSKAGSFTIYIGQAIDMVKGNMVAKMKVMIDEANEKFAALEAQKAEAQAVASEQAPANE